MKAFPMWLWPAAGALGIGVAVGVIAARPTYLLPPIPVHAVSTASHDNFAIATGFVEDGTEGLFFLDFLTGDLKATVVNNRGPGFNAYYQYNIANDFNAAGAANPKYLMVTGLARDIGRGGGRLASSVLYVVEATSGQLVAYGLPYSRTNQTAGKPQVGTFVPLARASLRTEFVRDQ
jgi:hypothetical protein